MSGKKHKAQTKTEESGGVPSSAKKKRSSASSPSTDRDTKTPVDLSDADMHKIICCGLDDVIDGKTTFDKLFSTSTAGAAFKKSSESSFVMPMSDRLARRPTRINFKTGDTKEDCKKEFQLGQDLVTQKLIPEMMEWAAAAAATVDDHVLTKLSCGFHVAGTFDLVHATVPVTAVLMKNQNPRIAKLIVTAYRNHAGRRFPAVFDVLVQILKSKALASVHTECVDVMAQRFGWYLYDAKPEDVMKQLTFADVKSCIDAVRESSTEIEPLTDFRKQLLYYMPEEYKQECLRQKLLVPVANKVLNVDAKCIDTQGQRCGNTRGEMLSNSNAAKKCHANKTCACFCTCSKHWHTLCWDGLHHDAALV